jgi:hypothetical protein
MANLALAKIFWMLQQNLKQPKQKSMIESKNLLHSK